jgi:glutaredoxin
LQLIQAISLEAERYVAENYQRQIRPPPDCPHCHAQKRLWAHGYYTRYLSRLLASSTLRISVRRFQCRQCSGTVSILPSFVQPYLLVQNATVEGYFKGAPYPIAVKWWASQLRRYWKRFLKWIPELDGVLGGTLGRSPPYDTGGEWRSVIAARYGNVDVCTLRIVLLYKITLFGRYRCHQPNGLFGKHVK